MKNFCIFLWKTKLFGYDHSSEEIAGIYSSSYICWHTSSLACSVLLKRVEDMNIPSALPIEKVKSGLMSVDI